MFVKKGFIINIGIYLNIKNIFLIFGKYCLDIKKNRVEKWIYKILNLDIYVNIYECIKLYKYKLI